VLRVAWGAPRRAALHGSRPALQPALHLFWFEQLRLMSWCCVPMCITYLLPIVRGLTFFLLYRVNLARRAGGAVRAVWRLPHWRPDFWVPLRLTCRATCYLSPEGLRKETLPSHVMCNSILRFALCHGCKESVVPRRLPVMWMWEAVTLPNFALWSEHVEGLGWYKLELRCSQLQVG